MLKVVFQQMRASPFSAMELNSRLDLTEIFGDVDDVLIQSLQVDKGFSRM
jgi:hypothetical protein